MPLPTTDDTTRPPRLSRLYARAAIGAVRSRLSFNGTLSALPDDPVSVLHPGISVAQAEAYRRLVGGEAFDGVHRASLPSVLVHTAAFPVQMALMSAENFPLQLMGMVHLSNEVHHRHQVLAGQALRIQARARNPRAHRRGTQVDIVTEIRLADQQESSATVLWSSTSTYLSRGTYIAGRPTSSDQREVTEPFIPPPKTALWSFGAEAGRDYAAVSGDYNPIHLSGISAKALGMPGPILHGMFSAARMLEGREPEAAGHRWEITFEAPVRLPGRVAFAVEQDGDHLQRFTGWNPKPRADGSFRRHFRGTLHLPE
ncbi:MaoC/PaaZ C-terminal domain-containing protein [Nesterenkonia flava]|uniref:MaoC/PaaZ C-terminal domain-containing protein n=1 Tax=Nesterenkonia flava TaxID=469799 RepID=A0ABU1FQN2_9MICC|nr:MaoC/PaaZ C-terminal domain-containing protein [Nesterenkonia flava]MDR5710672.1 MaoC/PaaZ C-terminal domain-containing protein [Nesterenkonia flava]